MRANLAKLVQEYSSKGAYENSRDIDRELGIDTYSIELKILNNYGREKNTNWIGLDEQTLQTPYEELFEVFNHLKAFSWKTIIDFGAAYGRVGLVAKFFNPKAEFFGFENLEERARYGNSTFEKFGITNAKIFEENVLGLNFEQMIADIYFVYDFSDLKNIKFLLKQLCKKYTNDEPFFLIARGKAVRSLIIHEFREFYALNGVIHGKEWSLFSSHMSLES